MSQMPTEWSAEGEEIQRRRKLADALRGQSMAPVQFDPRGRVSWTQGLGKIAQAFAANKGEQDATARQNALVESMRTERDSTWQRALEAMQGRPEIAPESPEAGGMGPGRPAMPGDQREGLGILAASRDPMQAKFGQEALLKQFEPQKNVVLGRSLVNPQTGAVVGVDQTWQQEQEATRQAREAEATARREDRRQELEMRLQDARLSREDRANMQREMVQLNAQARQDAIRLAAAVRPAGGGSGGRAPVGYRFSSDGETLEPIPGGPKDGNKQLPTQALKLQQAELDAIGTAASLSSDLTSIKAQIEGGKLQLGPVNNLVAQGRNIAGMSTPNSKNFASFKANLERLRNESLRLNKGVQTEGDSQRAWNELIQNINDPGVVQQRIDEIVALNDRAVQLRKMNVDVIRGNYGADPLDTSGYSTQPATVGANRGSSGQWSGPDRRETPRQGGRVVVDF